MGQTRNRVEKRDRLLHYRGGQCVNCGLKHDGTNGFVLDLHHLDESTKLFALNTTNANRTMKTLHEEADKCIILCANCHRLEHHKNKEC